MSQGRVSGGCLRRVRWVACVCAMCALGFIGTAPTQGFTFHKYQPYQPPAITEVPPGLGVLSGKLKHVSGVAVSGGHLWVGDLRPPEGNSRIDEFSEATGEFELQLREAVPLLEGLPTGIAIGEVGGETQLYARSLDTEPLAVFNASSGTFLKGWTGAETPSKTFGEGGGVAVDNSKSVLDPNAGDVYVAATLEHAVDRFASRADGSEEYIGSVEVPELGDEPFRLPEAIAVDEVNGDLFVVDSKEEGHNSQRPFVDIFEPEALGEYRVVGRIAGTPSGPFGLDVSLSLAVDGPEGDIYVSEPAEEVVDEFRLNGEYLGRITDEEIKRPGKPFEILRGVAVDPGSHDVFVGDSDNNELGSETHLGEVDRFGPNVTIPDASTEAPSNLKLQADPEVGSNRWSVRLLGSVNPDQAGAASCWFVWGTSKPPDRVAPCTAGVPNGNGPVQVRANLSGLEPDTTYFYRLEARNANGTTTGNEVEDVEFTTPGPGLGSESVSEVTSSSAKLQATLLPHDAPAGIGDLQEATITPATYYFQYSTASTVGCENEPEACVSVPMTARSIGSGAGEVEVSARPQGLSPGTVYHYRVVVANEAMPARRLERCKKEEEEGIIPCKDRIEPIPFGGADRTFRTLMPEASLTLPDGRAWELVSPADKRGAVILPIAEAGLDQAAVDGAAFTFLTSLPTEPEPKGYGDLVQVLARRGAAGWSSEDLNLARSATVGVFPGDGHEYRYFSEDLSTAVVEPQGAFSPPKSGEASPPASGRTPYLRHDQAGFFGALLEPLVTGCPSPGQPCAPDLQEGADVPPGTEFNGEREFPTPTGNASFVGATPDAEHLVLNSSVQLTEATAPSGGLYEWSAGEPAPERLRLVSVLPEGAGAAPGPVLGGAGNAISSDGSHVFYATEAGHLYMRDVPAEETELLDAPEIGSPPASGRARLQAANADGTEVFFTDGERLTAEAGAIGADLYVCEATGIGGPQPACRPTDITPVPQAGQPGAGESAQVGAVLGTGEGGGYVYFVADGVLAAGASPGDSNLYVAHEQGGAWKATFIATLSADDAPDWAGELNARTSRASLHGTRLAFMSDRSLTGYDNRDAKSGKLDEEVYEYDAASNKLVCASCDPSGARPEGVEYGRLSGGLAGGDRVWPDGQWLAANVPGWTPYSLGVALHQSRYLFDDGRLFFNSGDALAPQDGNGNEDIYEYEPPGVGGCTTSSTTYGERSEGCVGLISSGRAAGESAYLDASEEGGDVFFLTAEKLVKQDTDTALDVYDAHECTSVSPCPSPPAEAPPLCESASSCRAAPEPLPSLYGAPPSATFSGAGNLAPETPVVTTGGKKSAAQIRAQALAKALKACRAKPRAKRAACERVARRRYGTAAKAKRAAKRKHAARQSSQQRRRS